MDENQIKAALQKAQVCRLGLCDEGRPYVVPLCFGYDGGALYFHCGPRGRKLDVLRRNNNVCFEVDEDVEVLPGESACKWSIRSRSVIGFGTATVVQDAAEKRKALEIITRHYADVDRDFPEEAVARTTIVRVDVESMTGRSMAY